MLQYSEEVIAFDPKIPITKCPGKISVRKLEDFIHPVLIGSLSYRVKNDFL